MPFGPRIIDLGRLAYADAYQRQLDHHAEVLAARESGSPDPGRILLVEHDPPVITVSHRPSALAHLVATPAMLANSGVTIAQTDRGGDITYHGPGQLVVYPILDLNLYRLGLHDYMRLLEAAAIDTCQTFGVNAQRDPAATGVWVPPHAQASSNGAPGPAAKVCAMGVRIRRWVSLHGLALNVTTNLEHFRLIVPCGLSDRPVTSLERELGPDRCPGMESVKRELAHALTARLLAARQAPQATSSEPASAPTAAPRRS